ILRNATLSLGDVTGASVTRLSSPIPRIARSTAQISVLIELVEVIVIDVDTHVAVNIVVSIAIVGRRSIAIGRAEPGSISGMIDIRGRVKRPRPNEHCAGSPMR